jgi:Ca-activated chloride channel family protein
MKYLLISVLAFALVSDPLKIGKINSAKAEARKAYTSGDYKTAIAKYRYLIDSLNVTEDEIMLNLANAYYLSKDTAQAFASYQSLVGSTKNEVRSKAQQQLGMMNYKRGKLEEALSNFKQAIKADPANGAARYDYEMLKKKLDEKKKQEEQQKDQNKDQKQNKDQNKDQQKKDEQKKDQEKKDQEKKDQEKKDQQNKDQQQKEQEKKEQEKKDQEQKQQQGKDQQEKKDPKKDEQPKDQEQKDDQNKEKKDVPPQVSEKLQQMKISEEKAKMILEAMKNQEAQYLQQNKRKATKPKDKGKPDW